MKSLVVHSLVVVFLVLLHSCNGRVVAPEKFRLSLAQDSGYISSGDALSFLLDAKLIDTIRGERREGNRQYSYLPDDTTGDNRHYKNWLSDELTDTIGKYYAFSDTGNYIVALSLDNDLFLLELTSQSDIVHYDLYGHGSHPCCWNSLNDILKRYGPYFGISICGTGSAYCSDYLHLFKDKITPRQEGIPVSEYAGAFGEAPGHILTSDMQFADTTLTMQYELENFIEDYNSEKKTISTRQFTVKFVYRNNRFETDEMYKFDGILY